MKTWYAFGLLALLSLTGCAATIYDTFDDPGRKAMDSADLAFLSSYRQTQALRSSLHLPLMDWCSECYYYDHKWALRDARCVDRVTRYQHGDSTALFPPGYGVPGTETMQYGHISPPAR